MLTCWLFGIYIACALLYIDSCYHVRLYIFAYICMYLFCMAACCMITLFLYDVCLAVMFIYDIDMLTTLIDSLTCFNISSCSMIILLPFTCIFSFLYISFILEWWFSLLYIILFISTYCLFLLYTYLVYPISCLACV